MVVSIKSIKSLLIGLVICSATFYRFSLFGMNLLNLSFVVTILIFVLTLFQHKVIIGNTNYVLVKSATVLIFIYVSFGILSSIWSESTVVFGWMNTVKVLVMVLILLICSGDVISFKVINIGWLISSIIAFYTLLQYGEYYSGGIRYSIVMADFEVDPNVFFPLFIVPVVLILVNFFNRNNNNIFITLISMIYLICMGYYLMISGSRGALLAVVSAMAICVYVSKKSWKWVLLILACAIAVFFIMPNFISSDLLARFTIDNLRATGGSGRIDIWENAIQYYRNEINVFNFLFGSGINSAKIVLGRTTHNMFIECLIEYGLFGIINFVATYILLLVSSIRKKNVIAISVLTGTIIWGLTVAINNFLLYWMLLYYVLMILINDYGPKWFQNVKELEERIQE